MVENRRKLNGAYKMWLNLIGKVVINFLGGEF